MEVFSNFAPLPTLPCHGLFISLIIHADLSLPKTNIPVRGAAPPPVLSIRTWPKLHTHTNFMIIAEEQNPFFKERWILTPHTWSHFNLSCLFISAAPPFEQKTYCHLRSLDMNTGSRTFNIFAQAGEINMNLNVHLKHSGDNTCPLFLELCLICLKINKFKVVP